MRYLHFPKSKERVYGMLLAWGLLDVVAIALWLYYGGDPVYALAYVVLGIFIKRVVAGYYMGMK